MFEYIALGILAIALGAQTMRSFSFFRKAKGVKFLISNFEFLNYRLFFWISIVIVFGFSLFLSVAQYFVWYEAGPPSIYFLPPYQSIWYWIQYSFQHFWLSYVISLGIALLFWISTKFLNEKFNERFFWPEEYYIGALSIFLSGQPGWILYLIFLFFITIPLAGIFSLIFKKRLSFYYLWIPMGIVTIIISRTLIVQEIWRIINF